MKMEKIGLVVILLAVLPTAVFAQEVNAPSETTFKAGAGLIVMPSPYRGGELNTMPAPLILYKRGDFTFFGTQFTYNAVDDDGWLLQGIGKLRIEGYDEDNSRHLRGMGDRDQTFEIGAGLQKNLGYFTLNTTFTNDLLGKHNGHEVRVFVNKHLTDVFDIKDLTITPAIGTSLRNKNLNNYYYGVRAAEATATRAYYKAGGSEHLFAGLNVNYPMSEKWELFCTFNVEWFGREIRSSPIVDEDYLMTVFVGTMYNF